MKTSLIFPHVQLTVILGVLSGLKDPVEADSSLERRSHKIEGAWVLKGPCIAYHSPPLPTLMHCGASEK